ncbi:MAG: phosphatidylglycerophosphatase A [Desulfobulbaceae bacterium]
MDRLLLFIATGCGSGYLPKAPGTWGSLLGVAVWAGVQGMTPLSYGGVVAALFVIGLASAGAAEKILDKGDPSIVVIDEIVGQLIALAGAPFHAGAALLGFLLFRFFDILKPFPIGWLDKHFHGGLGIMLDDVAAGCCALVLSQLTWRYLLP